MSETYWTWVAEEASKINSDGCSKVPDWSLRCCYEHDLAYYYGRCPRDAFRKSSWTSAKTISRRRADWRFFWCNPWYLKHRLLGVRVGGQEAWNRHRKERP